MLFRSAPRAEQNQLVDPSFGNAAGNYTFEIIVDLTGYDISQVSLAGQWSVDNLGTDILVNGLSMGITSPGFGGYTPFTFTADNGLVAGLNMLDFVVNNLPTTPNPAGLRVDLVGRLNIQPTLHIELSGTDVVVSWSPIRAAQKLQSAPTVAGPWLNIVGAASPYTTSASGAPRFFRVVE